MRKIEVDTEDCFLDTCVFVFFSFFLIMPPNGIMVTTLQVIVRGVKRYISVLSNAPVFAKEMSSLNIMSRQLQKILPQFLPALQVYPRNQALGLQFPVRSTSYLSLSNFTLMSQQFLNHKQRTNLSNPTIRTLSTSSSSNTINDREVNKFNAMSKTWWDPVHNPLIAMNVIRVEYIRRSILEYYDNNIGRSIPKRQEFPTQILPLNGLSVLDIGCGGGLLSESLARLGASSVIGIDPSKELVNVAQSRSQNDSILSRCITYKAGTTAEQLLEQDGGNGFDAVFLLEVIEHVENQQQLLSTAIRLLRPGGLLFVSTINRTKKSFLVTILGAEYVMGFLPRGTHQWNKYLSPSEVQKMMLHMNVQQLDVTGMTMEVTSPLKFLINRSSAWSWKLDSNDHDINWIGCYRKTSNE